MWKSFLFHRKRFANVNNTIKSVEKSTSSDELFINVMARLHDLICDIVDDLNACFFIQVYSKNQSFNRMLNVMYPFIVCWSPDNVQLWNLPAGVDIFRVFVASGICLSHGTIAKSGGIQLHTVLFVWISNADGAEIGPFIDGRWQKSFRFHPQSIARSPWWCSETTCKTQVATGINGRLTNIWMAMFVVSVEVFFTTTAASLPCCLVRILCYRLAHFAFGLKKKGWKLSANCFCFARFKLNVTIINFLFADDCDNDRFCHNFHPIWDS